MCELPAPPSYTGHTFGAMLPVRLMGALYTLRAGSIARFELTCDLKGEEWRMRLGDQDLADLITSADPARIRAVLPRMNPEPRQIAQTALKEIEEAGK
ncbi:MAG TPA: hypothetical protein VE715_08790 [Blastocatellia bacterium]|nr:hypothetical protein [Blastocatellia bacterium]